MRGGGGPNVYVGPPGTWLDGLNESVVTGTGTESRALLGCVTFWWFGFSFVPCIISCHSVKVPWLAWLPLKSLISSVHTPRGSSPQLCVVMKGHLVKPSSDVSSFRGDSRQDLVPMGEVR